MKKHPVRIGPVVERIMARWSQLSQTHQQRLQNLWKEAVGKRIASHSRPESLRGQKLVVVVENSVWMNELTFLKEKIKMKLASAEVSREVSITDIQFKLQRGDMSAQQPPHIPPCGK